MLWKRGHAIINQKRISWTSHEIRCFIKKSRVLTLSYSTYISIILTIWSSDLLKDKHGKKICHDGGRGDTYQSWHHE